MVKKLSTYHYRKSMNGRRNWKDRNIISKLIQDNNKQLLVLEVANVQHEVRSVVKGFFWLTVISYLPREKHLLNFQVIAVIGLVIQHPNLCRYMLRWKTSSQSLTHEKNNYFFYHTKILNNKNILYYFNYVCNTYVLNLLQLKNLQLEVANNLDNISKAMWEEHVREEHPPVVSLIEAAFVLAITKIIHMDEDRYVSIINHFDS